jgi:hypothetical protein
MPKAISNNQDTERHDLKSLPEGYVVLRRLTYGEKVQRRAMVSGLKIRGMGSGKKDFEGEMNMVNEQATLFDFQRCIVEHNLEKDDNGTLLNFANIPDIRMLDPRVGEEIDSLLDKLNNFEDDEESGNS